MQLQQFCLAEQEWLFFAFTKDSENIQNWTVRSVMPFFFNSLEAILKRTWQLHCTLQKVQEIVHVILNCIVSWSNFQIIAEWCWRFWSYSNDQPARFWFASAYDFHSLLINEIFNLFTFLFLIRDICIFSNILLQRPPSPWLNICMSEWP